MSLPAAEGRSPAVRERVRGELLELLERLPVAHPIPAERQLADQLGVARMTIRRAVDGLVAEGRLMRQAGRGTFVADTKAQLPPQVLSFSAFVERTGAVPASRTTDWRLVEAGAQLARHLSLSPGAAVVYVERLRLVDGEPMGIERLHVPHTVAPGLAAEDLEDASFYALLAERWGVIIDAATWITEVTVTDQRESELLGVPAYSPAFYLEQTTTDVEGRPVEHVRSVFRGDRYRFVSKHSLRGEGPESATVTAPLGSSWIGAR